MRVGLVSEGLRSSPVPASVAHDIIRSSYPKDRHSSIHTVIFFSLYFSVPRVAPSVQQSSAPLQQVRVLVSFVVFCLVSGLLISFII